MGQPGNFLLNRVGTYMFWDNCWVSNFNQKNFFDKVNFFKNIFYLLFSENLFKFFFLKKPNFLKNLKVKKKSFFFLTLNFTKIWFIKFNKYVILNVFFFFLKRKKKKFFKFKSFFKSRFKFFKNKLLIKFRSNIFNFKRLKKRKNNLKKKNFFFFLKRTKRFKKLNFNKLFFF